MPVKSTSITAYREHKRSGSAATQRLRILKNLARRKHPASRRQLAGVLTMDVSSVAGRVNELVESGDIAVTDDKMICPISGITVEGLVLSEMGRARMSGDQAAA